MGEDGHPADGPFLPPAPVRRRVIVGGREPAGEWRLRLATDPVLLARFSALTYNGHRIHDDHPYATGVEGR